MAVHATTTVEARTEIDVWVHRDAMGDLERGVAGVVEAIDGVRGVETASVTDVTPRATDIRVTATVEVVIEELAADAAMVRDTLEDGVGVYDADPIAVTVADA